MKRITAWCLMFVAVTCVTTMSAHGASSTSQSGRFEQLKYFTQFVKPFRSTGRFEVSDQVLIWQTLTPVPSRMLVTPEGVFTSQANEELVAQPSAEPYVQSLKGLLSGDLQALDAAFTLQALSTGCFRLTPEDPLLSQVFSHFELCIEEQRAKSLKLIEKNGNHTAIALSYDEVEG